MRTPSQPARVLVADDDPLTRDALVGIVERAPSLSVAGSATDAPTAIDAALDLRPDIVLMDLDLPGLDGLSATLQIRRRMPGVRVVVVANRITDELALLALDAGAVGAVPKDLPESALVRTLDGVVRGEAAMSRTMALEVLSRLRRDRGDGRVTRRDDPSLTPRERQVLELLATGLPLDAVADRLAISAPTIRRHLRRIEGKLGAGTPQETIDRAGRLRAEAAAHPALRLGDPDIDVVTLQRAVRRLLTDDRR